jgi:hypothetical protein
LSDTFFYKIYHGNLAFSAIEEENLGEVIDKTYFPLLNLIEKNQIKIALELSGYSLEKIAQLRPAFITQFKKLQKEGLLELIGSGYMQIIAPLVPYEVNLLNHQVGFEVYEKLLGIKPIIAYINEQVFSKSLVDLYSKVGYKAIVMEWNNAYSIHQKSWKKEFAFKPTLAQGINTSIPLIWTDTIIFQQFQRVAHQEIEIEEYIQTIQKYLTLGYKALPLYSSDLEIFNYRPGRFETEACIKHDEWQTIEKVINILKNMATFTLPSEILNHIFDQADILELTTSTHPVLVKKQEKYSLSRWAAAGNGANYINTLCYNYFLSKTYNKKLLLQYWGSDYRTHTTKKKWNKAIKFLETHLDTTKIKKYIPKTSDIDLQYHNKKLIFKKDNYQLIFNPHKGMALEKITKDGEILQFGTVKHGDLDYISNGADFYTGTTSIESADTKKVTDLSEVQEYKLNTIDKNIYQLSSKTFLKDIAVSYKIWTIDLQNHELSLEINIKLKKFIKGSIRLGTLTLLPQSKDSNFWYQLKNGAQEFEKYYISSLENIEHHRVKSLLQSSSGGIGMTDNKLIFGVDSKEICVIEVDKKISYPFMMLQNSIDHDKYLTRVFFSVQEIDDTLKGTTNKSFRLKYKIKL